jgi:hypothetical protein
LNSVELVLYNRGARDASVAGLPGMSMWQNKAGGTPMALEALDWWVREQAREARHDAIAAYAAEMAGTRLDLDPDLESAGIEHMLNTSKVKDERGEVY